MHSMRERSKRGLLVSLTAIAVAVSAAVQLEAQGPPLGRLSGRVVNASTGQPVTNARLQIAGTQISVQTDLDGRYLFTTISSNTVDVVVRRIGFAQKTVTDVSISSGQVTTLNITMEPSVLQLDAITVTADVEAGSAVAVLDMRRTSENVIEAVGREEIAAIPASDAADIAKLNIFLTDLGHFPLVNQVMADYFQEPYPARAAVGVAALPKGAQVEMDAIMHLGG